MSPMGSLEDVWFCGSSSAFQCHLTGILSIAELFGVALSLAPLEVTWLLWLQMSHPDITSREAERPSLDHVSLRARRHFQKPLAKNGVPCLVPKPNPWQGSGGGFLLLRKDVEGGMAVMATCLSSTSLLVTPILLILAPGLITQLCPLLVAK